MDFTLSNARRFYSSMGNPLGVKGLSPCLVVFILGIERLNFRGNLFSVTRLLKLNGVLP